MTRACTEEPWTRVELLGRLIGLMLALGCRSAPSRHRASHRCRCSGVSLPSRDIRERASRRGPYREVVDGWHEGRIGWAKGN